MQDELEKINEEASDKVLEIEQKYNEIRKPLYDQHNDLIKSIPDFWLTAAVHIGKASSSWLLTQWMDPMLPQNAFV
ncbi:NAP1-related protein 2-like [Vicia villosa]|uniref:NAP1-related protein 2-like n=1 Tax=Vicia villosa TaxID=3911 RepID=UPI00273CD8E7|nr:NAP1-related protein 2-like [Vicia villosa]